MRLPSQRRVALDGKYLDDVDDSIVLQGVDCAAGRDVINAVSIGGISGQRVTGRRRDTLDITVRFAIDIKRSTFKQLRSRSDVLEKVNKWARNGGKLTLSWRDNRYADVVLAQAPGEGDIWQWTSEYSIVFRAYAVPYWQEELDPILVDMFGAATNAGSVAVKVGGNTQTIAEEIIVQNRSGALINNLMVKMGSQKMQFGSLNMQAGERLRLYHNAEGIQLIVITGGGTTRSVMANRTPESVDEFEVNPGNHTFSYEADRAVSLGITCRGRYL